MEKLEKHIGTKIINATPMSRGDYNELRGWTIPEDENPLDEGYLVDYLSGYLSWSPKMVFEESYIKSSEHMVEIRDSLLTNNYTHVVHDKDFIFNAPHHFEVYSKEAKLVGAVNFQKGPIKENGVNGVANEDLLIMVKTRLEHFNQTEFRCKENSMAITKIEETLMWLRKRTLGREDRGVEGTHKV